MRKPNRKTSDKITPNMKRNTQNGKNKACKKGKKCSQNKIIVTNDTKGVKHPT